MSQIILGNNLAIEQPIRYGFSPTSGYTTTRTWKSANRAALDAFTPALSAAHWQWEITAGLGAHTLVATLAALADEAGGGTDQEQPISTWELLNNRHELDLLESTITPLGNVQLLPDDVSEIKKALDATHPDELDYLAARGPVAYEIFLLMQKGTRSVILDQPVLSRSQLVSKSYLVKASFANAGKILKTSSLKTQEAIPAEILFELPDDVSPVDVIFPAGGPNPLYPKTPRVRYGWRKTTPTANQVSYNKFQISQAWEYGLWSVLLYGEPI